MDRIYGFKPYEGTLGGKTETDPVAKKAINSWRAQRQRCNNKNCRNYAFYGKKGVVVEYSSRDFVGWYISEYSKKNWFDPTVGRIDHSKNYSFDNIEMQERVDNSIERNRRLPNAGIPRLKHRKMVEAYKNGVLFMKFGSVQEAADYFGKRISTISVLCSGINKASKEGLVFRRINE